MKLSKKLVACTMLLFVLFLCINVCSADEQINETFAACDVDEITSDNVNSDICKSLSDDSLHDEVPSDDEIIYVSETGDDLNDGKNMTNAVATIKKALEITTNGKIVLLPGTHKTNDLGIISDNLTIAGEGKAIIDAGNNNRILYVGEEAHVVLKNIIMVNGYSIDESGALLANSNELTLINCTLANSSAGQNNGGAIFNVGKLTIINTTISDCSAKRGGAVFTQISGESVSVSIFNSTFENNIASGYNEQGGGAVYVQRTYGFYNFKLTVENTKFKNNRAHGESCGGAIALIMLDATAKITNCQFISNHANGKDTVGGGAIYTTGADNYQRYGNMAITGTLFENNTCDANGGAVYAKTTTVTVSNSVLINNSDANGIAVYGFKTELSSPSITLNDNWWGSNGDPKSFVGGNSRYSPTINRWAILTIENDTPIVYGNTVRLTVRINQYTDGLTNGTLSKPIDVKRDLTIKTSFENISGVLENGEFSHDYTVLENLKFIMVSLDSQTEVLYAMSSPITIQINEITAKRFDKVKVAVNVTSSVNVNQGNVELYVGDEIIVGFEVKDNRATGDVIIAMDIGVYELTVRYVGGTPLFDDNEINTTLTVDGVCELNNDTFFNYFDDDGLLRDEIMVDELIFHGDFSNLGVNTITVARPLSVIGDNARLFDIALDIRAGDSKVSNMAFMADRVEFTMNDGAVISLTGDDIELTNVFINYTAPDTFDAYAVLAKSANCLKLSDSTIIFKSNNLGAIHHALHVSDSDNIEIKGNSINASLPARDVDWHNSEPFFDSIDQDTVVAIGIQNCNDGILTNNEINVVTTGATGFNPTVDGIIVYGVNDFEISWNNITQIDTVNAGRASYSNALDLYAFDKITIRYNNIMVNTTSGIEAKGTAYPIQATGPYGSLVIDHNNLTSISNGPALGIYSQNYNGITDITITFNNIDATGFATQNNYALVSGMELQDTVAKVYNNTIYSQSKGSYGDVNELYGISYAQDTEGLHTYDIKDNTIVTEGRYAIYLKSAKDTDISGNALYAHEFVGDEAVRIIDADNCAVENNGPHSANIMIAVDNITVGKQASINITSAENIHGFITVLINGEKYANSSFDGNKLISVSNLGIGEYNVTVIFKSDDLNYFDGQYDAKFTVSKLNSTISLNVDSLVRQGEWTVISVNITDNATGIVIVIVNGTNYTIELSQTNNVSIIFNKTGNYSVVANYIGDDTYYGSVSDEKVLAVEEKLDVNIKIEVPGVIRIGDTIAIDIQCNSDGEMTIEINGEAVVGNYTILSDGTYVINVSSAESENYKEGFASKSFTVFKEESHVDIALVLAHAGEKSIIIFNVTENATGNVVVNVNGTEYPINLSDGKLELVLKAGEYQVFATYVGDNRYNASVSDVKLLVVEEKLEANIEIAVPGIVRVGDTIVIAPQCDSDGALTIKVNGEVTDGNYTVLANGTYIISVSSAETENYKAGSANVTLTALKLESFVNANTIEITEGEVAGLTVSVNNGATGKVAVIINDKTYLAEIVGDVATVNIPDLSFGHYDVHIMYLGDEKYNVSSGSTSINVKKAMSDEDLNIVVSTPQKSNSLKFAVKLPSDATGTLTVIIDGKTSYDAILINGEASIDVEGLSLGKHNVEVVYSGDSKYSPVYKSTEMEVKNPIPSSEIKLKTKFIAKKKTFKAKAKVKKYSVYLKSGNKPVKNVWVTLKIKGKTYRAKTNSKGKATFKIKKLNKKGRYTATLKFKANKTYDSARKNVKITVKK